MEKLNSAEKQAIYRLGQMDMKASIADMLTDLADGTQGDMANLPDAAQRVRNLEVAHGDS